MMLKRIILVLGVIAVLFSSVFVRSVYAQSGTPWYNQSYRTWAARVFDHTNDTEIFGERYTFAQVQWIIYSLMTVAAGSDTVACVQFLNTGTADVSVDAKNKFKECMEAQQPVEEPGGYIREGPQYASNSPFNPQNIASGVRYTKDTINNFRLIPQAQAQGYGYDTLSPIQELWRAMRNAAYLLLSVGIIILAFMVMFRVKISPQAVISVQSALPRIVAALLAITFSYAIVGFMIDLIYIMIGGISVLLSASTLSNMSAIEVYQQMISFNPIAQIVLMNLFIALLILLVGLGVTFIPVFGWLGGILMLLIALTLVVAILIVTLKILWTIMKAFVMIVIYTIFSPIILLGILFSPGGSFTSWLKSLLANLAVFPLIGFMTFLAHFFFWGFIAHSGNKDVQEVISWLATNLGLDPYQVSTLVTKFEAPGTMTLPIFPASGAGVQNMQAVGLVLSVGILFMIPQAANIIKSTIERKPFAYGSAIGAGLATAAVPISASLGKTWGVVSGGVEKGFTEKIATKVNPPKK